MVKGCPHCKHLNSIYIRLQEQYRCARCHSVLRQPEKLRLVRHRIVFLLLLLCWFSIGGFFVSGGMVWISLLMAAFYTAIIFSIYLIQRLFLPPLLVSATTNHPYCSGCGYDIRGITNNLCPECGTISKPNFEDAPTN